MKTLVRNCLHGSSIVVCKERDLSGRTRSILKSSSTAEGVRNLRTEHEGYLWYNQALKTPIPVSAAGWRDSYFQLRIGHIEGHRPAYLKGLLANKEAIEAGIRHYCEVWRRETANPDAACVHGDFSLDNVILAKSGPFLVDWEHFSRNALPIGFDGLYLLFECLWFEIEDRKLPQPEMIDLIRRNMDILRQAKCLHPCYEEAPLTRVKEMIRSKPAIWGEQLQAYGLKMPILKWSSDAMRGLDLTISRHG